MSPGCASFVAQKRSDTGVRPTGARHVWCASSILFHVCFLSCNQNGMRQMRLHLPHHDLPLAFQCIARFSGWQEAKSALETGLQRQRKKR